MASLRYLIDTILKNPSGKLWVQIFRYLISGGIAFIIDAGTLTLLTEIFGRDGVLWWTAAGFSLGLLTTYLFSIFWVFDNRSLESRTAELLIFIIIGITGFVLTEFLTWLFVVKGGMHYLISKIIITVIVFVWNFAAKKLLLFRSK